MNIMILGGGFVGVTTATVFAEQGHDVMLVEPWAERREALAAGKVPFFEPGLTEAFATCQTAGTIQVTDTPEAAAEITFICVGTPAGPDGDTDTTQLEAATEQLAALDWEQPTVIVIKSTVPPGTCTRIVRPLLEGSLGTAGTGYGLAMNPEFLREGSALEDARAPDRVVYGTNDTLALERLRTLYGTNTCPVAETTLETAELAKYAANALLATKVAFVNEIARISEAVGAEIDEVVRMVGLDHRINPAFLRAGPGFGGSCFPKDVAALVATSRRLGVDLGLVEAVLASNAKQAQHVVALTQQAIGDLNGKRIAILGVAFKPLTSDVRESRAIPISQALADAGAQVVYHDPEAGAEFAATTNDRHEAAGTIEDALTGADACILHTDWPQYLEVAPSLFSTTMATPIVIDTRRIWDPTALKDAGVSYWCIGRSPSQVRFEKEPLA